ncbi:hypothetical protein AB0K09_12410 [Streptomyces sp. NPDC049577]|uniref:hypothetical protein n=1 Tax=Streptomyces sp. NPDC049577 TaxID=3155153 RepID=UPI00342659BB
MNDENKQQPVVAAPQDDHMSSPPVKPLQAAAPNDDHMSSPPPVAKATLVAPQDDHMSTEKPF